MNTKDIIYFAKVSAINSRIEAMKVDNKVAEYQGRYTHWTSDYFESAASDLEQIAEALLKEMA